MPKSIEAEGVTVDEAIQNALNALGLGRDSVEIEIVHHPRSGFLGIGARRAKVRATLREQVMRDGEEFDMAPEGGGRGRRRRRSSRGRSPRGDGRPSEARPAPSGQPRRGGPPPAAEPNPASAAASPSTSIEQPASGGDTGRGGRSGRRRGGRRGRGGEGRSRSSGEEQQRGDQPRGEQQQRGEQSAGNREPRGDSERSAPPSRRVDLDALLRRAVELAERLVAQMGFEARVDGRIDGNSISLAVEASDGGSVLIGRRGTTLDALEHLIGRMTLGVEPGSRVRVAVDVCGYRDRRRAALEELAKKLKEHAVASGRRAQITPLSPQDRSVFLAALAGDDSVSTRALGTGFYRRVLVVPRGVQGDGSAPDDFGEDGNLLQATGNPEQDGLLEEAPTMGDHELSDAAIESGDDGDDDGRSSEPADR